MAHPEHEDSKLLFAKEIAALTDRELDRYLDECRDDAGVVIVAVKDPENLLKSSIERLRYVMLFSSSQPCPLPMIASLTGYQRTSSGSDSRGRPPPTA